MTKEEIKQRNESKEFLKDLQYYLFQNKRSPKIDKLSVLLDNDEKRIADLEAHIEKMKCCGNCAFQLVIGGVRDSHCVKCNACSEW